MSNHPSQRLERRVAAMRGLPRSSAAALGLRCGRAAAPCLVAAAQAVVALAASRARGRAASKPVMLVVTAVTGEAVRVLLSERKAPPA